MQIMNAKSVSPTLPKENAADVGSMMRSRLITHHDNGEMHTTEPPPLSRRAQRY